MIKFLDLQKINLQYQEEIESKILDTYRSGWYLQGKETENFENNLNELILICHAQGPFSTEVRF